MRYSFSLGRVMKGLTGIVFGVCMVAATMQAQDPTGSQPPITDVFKFDEWGDLRFSEERVRLNNIVDVVKAKPLTIVYLIIHAGQTACVNEAKARGIRAKNYLVSRGISKNRIVWIDAGWRKNVWTIIWITSPEMGKPNLFHDDDLRLGDVKLQRNCRIKYRGR